MIRRRAAVLWALPTLAGITIVLLILAGVEVLLRLDVLNHYIIPLPSDVLLSIPRIFAEEDVPQRFLQTLGEAAAAWLLAGLAGAGGGIALYRWTLLRKATASWVAAFAAAPLILAYPLFLVTFGRTAVAIIMVGFLAGLAPVILKTLEGLNAVRPVLLDVGRSFKLDQRRLFWMVLFPAAVPTIFAGLRLGLIFSMINVVGVEYMINFGGLGQFINDLAERYDLAGMYAATILVGLAAAIVFAALERVEQWMLPRL